MGIASNNRNLLSKIATSDGHAEKSPYFDGWKAYDSNPFHPTNNPNGVIQMGLAENQLCFDLIKDWIKRHPEASVCTSEGVDGFKDIANFQDYHGLSAFTNAVAKFMGRVRGNKATFNPDNIVMSGGATGAAETISFCIADPGDAFLVPSPYYPGFDRDVGWRTGVQLVPVVCESSNNFIVTINALEAAYKKAMEAGVKIKGLLINNPSNPLGTILDRETLSGIVRFIDEKRIHLVCDEIYAATVFTQPDFIGISEILEEVDCDKNLVHVLYSLSKDMGFPGFRVGIIYSYNKEVVCCARKMSSFGMVSTQTQHLVSSMLSDDEFVGKFVDENAKRLALRHKTLTRGLAQVGITTLKSNAGLFFWMDLRHLLRKPTVDEEMKLWRVIIDEVKLNVSPGSSFHCTEPGWFRVCFANADNETVEVALRRIHTFIEQGKETEVPVKSHRSRRSNLHLSISSLRCEDSMMTPTARTPHTPIPQSPLVRAV
nr:1-aminocyclopropane-1-carboxylic acid synthase [Delphinium grandiflorum]